MPITPKNVSLTSVLVINLDFHSVLCTFPMYASLVVLDIIQFKIRLKRVHFFHIKIDRNPNAFQLTDRFKPVHNFTSKAANTFYQHKIYFLLPAIAEHTLELCAILRAFSAGEIDVHIGYPLVEDAFFIITRR